MQRSQKLRFSLAAACMAALAAAAWADVPRQISYQGRLTGNGDDPVNLQIRFYDAETGGNELFFEEHTGVPRPSGLFSINIGSQTTGGVPDSALDYTSQNPSSEGLWLGVSVWDGSQWVELTPRTRLVMVPYAAKATIAEALVRPGTFEQAVSVQGQGSVGIAATPASWARLRVAGLGPGTNTIVGEDDSDSAAPSQIKVRGATDGNKQLLIGFNTLHDYGSMQAVWQDVGYKPLVLNPCGGNVGIGTSGPVHPLQVVAPLGTLTGLVINCDYDAPGPVAQQLIIASRTGPERLKLGYHTNYDYASIQAENYGIESRPLILNPNGGNVGIGVTPAEDAALHIGRPAVTVKLQDDLHNTVWWMRQNSGGSEFAIGFSPNTADENIKLRVNNDGRTFVSSLQITGGSDLAEPFAVAGSADEVHVVRPGMVVVIDPDNPGQLKLATEAYDRKVAGVISGAGGVKPGMIMKQEGHPIGEGEHPIAMAGKIYVWCDASYGPIEPGDRLTTSDTPGHAMKVTDEPRAPGAVIGKAMTCLAEDKGLVLVLVQPQ